MLSYVVMSTVSADDLAPFGAKVCACTVMYMYAT